MERGAIDAGLAGDKVVGFDPATAPMETDAEAGGTATQPLLEPSGPKIEPGFNGTAHGTAMKPLPGEASTQSGRTFVAAIAGAVVLAIGLGLLFLFFYQF
jgi:hypothetical protein